MQIKLTTGERLTDLRREHNLTLEQVAEQTGIVKSTLSNYENDRKPDVNLNALEKLAGSLSSAPSAKNSPDTLVQFGQTDFSDDLIGEDEIPF